VEELHCGTVRRTRRVGQSQHERVDIAEVNRAVQSRSRRAPPAQPPLITGRPAASADHAARLPGQSITTSTPHPPASERQFLEILAS